MNSTRRRCLRLLATGPALALAGPLIAAGGRRIERVGLQLFTVRELMAKDAAATLAAVAGVGYAEVETAGTGSLTPARFADALGSAGLTAPSAHVPLERMAQQPDAVLEEADIIGYGYLVMPWLPPEQRTPAGYGLVIDTLNRFGERCAAAGIQLCYHNHDFEFTRLGNDIPYQLLLTECDPTLVRFELDLYWAAQAGVSAAAMLTADPARFPLCHVKDRSPGGEMMDVGQGTLDFPALFAAGTGLKHYFVEHDQPADAMASIRTSYRAVSAMRF